MQGPKLVCASEVVWSGCARLPGCASAENALILASAQVHTSGTFLYNDLQRASGHLAKWLAWTLTRGA